MTIADPKEVKAFLDKHPEIQFFEIVFTNMAGVPRGKRLRRHEIEAVYANGRFLPGSILVNDITGQDVEATGLVWEDGDADRVARPIAGRITPAPWLGADVAQVPVTMYELDGKPHDLDPRHVLQRVIDRFAADGLVPVVACELEYYLVDARRTANGKIQLPPSPLTGDRASQHQVYGLREVEEASGFLRDLWVSADAMGIPLEGAISEYAPGQLELTLKHHADALRAGPGLHRFWAPATGQGIRFDSRTAVFADAFTYTYNTTPAALSFTGIHIAGAATGGSDDPATPSTWEFGGVSNVFKIGSIGDVYNTPASMDVATDAGGITTVNLSLPMSGTVRMENVQFGAQSFGPVAIDNIQFHRLNVKIGGL